MKKIRIPNEILYLTGICGLALAVAMIAASNFGVSPIVAPAYVLSCRVPFLTFGRAEYLIQFALFVVFCYIMGGFRTVYLSSFVNCLIYGAMLDFWRAVIPVLNPHITPCGSLPFASRATLYLIGLFLTAASVAMFFKSYMYPQVYDFFVRGVSTHFGIRRLKFKLSFDFCSLFTAVAMSFAFFGRLNGIGVGTLITTCTMGFLLEFFFGIYDKYFEFPPLFENFAKKFELK